jgi:leader peptidase (prepilin peptidase)/N-methyltransferase
MTEPLLMAYLTVMAFVGGACIGSFLNVCIHRIPREESIVHPRSRCPACGHPITWRDNIPLVSYFLLKTRCRHCGAAISPRYFVVELLTAFLFLAVWNHYGLDARTPVYLLMVSGLILGTFVDLDHMIIPDRVSLGGMAAGLLCSGLVPDLHGQADAWLGVRDAAVGLAAGSGILLLVAWLGRRLLKKDAMGLGDVKLLGAIGAFLGWPGVLFTVMLSSLVGSAAGVGMILGGHREWQSRIPYGPYLALGAVTWVLGGHAWWDRYVQWITGGL